MTTQKTLKLILISLSILIIIFSVFFTIQTLNYLNNLKFSNLDYQKIEKLKQAKEPKKQIEQTLKDLNLDTSNWKTYRNEEFGFEFRYPEGWKKKECEDYKTEDERRYCKEEIKQIVQVDNSNLFLEDFHMYLSSPGEVDITINYNINNRKQSIQKIFSVLKKGRYNESAKFKVEDFEISYYTFKKNNKKAIRESIKLIKLIEGIDRQEIYLTFLHKNYIFTIHFATPVKGSENSIKLFDKILNTFQFS